jgi:hypothetical protein
MMIKIILIGASLTFGAFLLRDRAPGQRLALRRLFGAVIVLTGVAAVLFPDATNWAARLVGVTRGADLLLYLFVMVFLFTTASLYQRIHQLETQITELTREIALDEIQDA